MRNAPVITGSGMLPLLRATLWVLFVLQSGAQTTSRAGNVVAPSISCDLPSSAVTVGGVSRWSNLTRLPINVTISGSSPVVGNLSVVGLGGCSQIYTRQSCVEVTIDEGPGHKPVDTNVTITGFVARQTKREVSTQLEIPIDADLRKTRIGAYIDKVAADGASRRETTQTRLAAFGNLRDLLAKYLSSVYMENKVGVFNVGCTYFRPTGTGSSTAITSKSIVVEIQNNGTFFDQPSLAVDK